MRIEYGFSGHSMHIESKTFIYTLSSVGRIHGSGNQMVTTRGIWLPVSAITLSFAELDVLVPKGGIPMLKDIVKVPLNYKVALPLSPLSSS